MTGKKTRKIIKLTIGLILTAATGCAFTPCPKTYDVRYVPEAEIDVDGMLDESEWNKAHRERDFLFPWEERIAPATKFSAIRDDFSLYFFFDIYDDDVVVEENFNVETAVAREDRVEVFFACDDELKEYFCLEIDPLGRTLDYAASYYRKFNNSWNLPGVCTAASITNEGYVVEGSIPLKSLEALGLQPLGTGRVLKAGLFRADFNRGQDSKLHEHWISWVDPDTKQPDFHVPSAFGCLQMAE